jgi:pimeloyl-ACP methyl ester carboxylesterase
MLAHKAEKPDGPIVYLGRPCHYASEYDFESRCHKRYWTTHRYAEDVIAAYDTIFDQLKSKYNIIGFNIIGFSGGGNIAGLLAARREDIRAITTIAGNVDNDFFTQYHRVSGMPSSLNMADYAQTLSVTPQIHYIAEDDRFVPPEIYQSYRAKLPHTNCTKAITVQGTTHLEGWDEQWTELRRQNLSACR